MVSVTNFKVTKRTRQRSEVGLHGWVIKEVEEATNFKFKLYVRKERKYVINDGEVLEQLETFYFRDKKIDSTLVIKWFIKYGEEGKFERFKRGYYKIDDKVYGVLDEKFTVKIINWYSAKDDMFGELKICFSEDVLHEMFKNIVEELSGKSYEELSNEEIEKLYNKAIELLEKRINDEIDKFIKEWDNRKFRGKVGNAISYEIRTNVVEERKSEYSCFYVTTDLVLKTSNAFAFNWLLRNVNDLPIFFP